MSREATWRGDDERIYFDSDPLASKENSHVWILTNAADSDNSILSPVGKSVRRLFSRPGGLDGEGLSSEL
jgi:hypothetical protein